MKEIAMPWLCSSSTSLPVEPDVSTVIFYQSRLTPILPRYDVHRSRGSGDLRFSSRSDFEL
jgi:hypothetical protein